MAGYVYRGGDAPDSRSNVAQDQVDQLRAQLVRSEQDRGKLYERLRQARRDATEAQAARDAMLDEIQREVAAATRTEQAALGQRDRARSRAASSSTRVRSLLAQLRQERVDAVRQQSTASVVRLERRVGELQGALADQLQVAAEARADRDRALHEASVMQEVLDTAHTQLTSCLPEFWAVRRHAREAAHGSDTPGGYLTT